ncbi:Uncharacterised protein [Delftia tsuruhatensis]|uniref:hypothetical protein n=1 Tax=Delftia tsuruhatensis TaxID=180282 RepID=UPI001E7C95AC|nr:hypothetical protein [Delftia tsuruhatensis]CAB5682398.1 Uncharacterised protein [Delftia tsuruhatensis]CAC9675790.1 Uncharacterised protein [Delftia tsuruhatensis]
MRATARKASSSDLERLQELLSALGRHGLHVPFERLEPILHEYQWLKEHRSLVNEVAHQHGPSHIQTLMGRPARHERQS